MAKFWKFTGLFVLGVFVLIIGTGTYFLHNFDLNKYKVYISEIVEQEIGRKLQIRGNASIGLSLIPTVVIEDVELSNASWAANPYMVALKKIELKFALLPLLKKQIVLDKMVLDSLIVNLETSADGQNNWTFIKKSQETVKEKPAEISSAVEGVQAIAPNPAMGLLIGFAAKSVEINDSVITIYQLKDNSKNVIALDSLEFSAPSADSQINISFDTAVDGQRIKGQAVLGSLKQLLIEKETYPVSLTAQAYGIDADINGSLENIFDNLQYRFEGNIYNPAGNMNIPETTLQAVITGNLENIAADIHKLNIVNNLITGKVAANIANKVPFVQVDLSGSTLDLQNFSQNSNFAWTSAFIKTAEAAEFVPNENIPYDVLKNFNAKASLKISQLIINQDLRADDVNLMANLNNGILNIDPLTFNIGGGKTELVAQVNALQQSVRLNFVGNNLFLQQLHKEFLAENKKDFGFLEGGSTDVQVNLSGSGKTYRQLTENLNGQVIAIVGESVVQTGALSFLKGNFIDQLLNVIKISSKKNTDINLVCAVVRTDIKNGIADFPKGIALQAKEMSLVSSGQLNLKNDKLNFSIQPYADMLKNLNVTQALSSFVSIKGTVQNPQISLNDESALKTLVGITAAGPVYLGGQVLLDANSSPCYTALQGTSFQNRFPAPGRIESAGQDINNQVKKDIKALKGVAKDLKKGAKDLLKSFK